MADSENQNLPPKITGTARRPKPNGWWSLPGHEFDGSREGVLKAIESAKFSHLVDGKEVIEDVPERWKRNIRDEIAELPSEFNHVTVHASVSIHKSDDGKRITRTYDFDVIGQIKL